MSWFLFWGLLVVFFFFFTIKKHTTMFLLINLSGLQADLNAYFPHLSASKSTDL